MNKKNTTIHFTPEDVKRLDAVEADRQKDKLFCHVCKGTTKQKFVFEQGELTEPNEIVFFDEKGVRQKNSGWTIEGRIWKISQCLGCEKLNLNVFIRQSPFDYDHPIHHFPPKNFRPFPMWITYLNKEYTEIVSEIYTSLNIGNKRLPLMGARTLLDMFILDKIGDAGNFKAKLKKLVDEKYITEASRYLLEIALEYGNAAIHRGYQPNENEMHDILDIIENLLYTEALKFKTEETKNNLPTKQKMDGNKKQSSQ